MAQGPISRNRSRQSPGPPRAERCGPMPDIHPTAIVEIGAELHETVRVGPYCIIEAGAVLDEGCVLDSQVRIYGQTRMGHHNRVCHGATIGSEPQDLGYAPARARPLVISHNYFMAFSHVGHDCRVGDHNIFANTATLGGHVELAHHIFLSGQVAVHQFCRVGAYVMIGGLSGVSQDTPPFVIANGQRAQVIGLNTVGLRRAGFDQGRRDAIKRAYKVLYRSGLRQEQALARLREDPSPDVGEIVAFVEGCQRGLMAHA
jgi:UDP-N-acetylglucosamine acyltransferase